MHGLPTGYDAADLLGDGAHPDRVGAPRLVPAAPGAVPSAPAAPTESRRRGGQSEHVALISKLRAFLVERGVTPDAVGGWRDGSGRQLSLDSGKLVEAFLFRLRHTMPASRSYVEETLAAMVEEQRQARRSAILARLVGRPSTDAGREALAAWVQAVTGTRRAEDIAVLAHWMWLVKRLATGQRSAWDLMPIVYGPQGSGKSTATERLCAPWAELVATVDAGHLVDERKFTALTTFSIGRWEEMQGASRSDVAALKHTLSAPTITYRRLNTHVNEILVRTMAFIGTSNDPVDVLIGDFTGARRFYQLTTPARCDQDAINRLDYQQVWQAVSESDADPLTPHLSLVQGHQATLVAKDAVSLWLESETWDSLTVRPADGFLDQAVKVPAYDPAQGEPFDDVAVRFLHWCKTVGQAPLGSNKLAQRLVQEGFVIRRPGAANSPRPRRYFRPLPPTPTTPGPDVRSETTSPAAGVPLGDAEHLAEVRTRADKASQPPSPQEDRFDDTLPF